MKNRGVDQGAGQGADQDEAQEARFRKIRAQRMEKLQKEIKSLHRRLGTIQSSIMMCPPEQLDHWADLRARAQTMIGDAEHELRSLEQLQRMSFRK